MPQVGSSFGQAAAFAAFIWFTAKFVWPPLMHAVHKHQVAAAAALLADDRLRAGGDHR